MLLDPVIQIFSYSLRPIAPFSWLGLNVSALDVLAAFRLCIALRQMREILHKQHVSKHGKATMEESSFIRSVSTTLTVVYGGETMTGE
jgi:hypothetical protein